MAWLPARTDTERVARGAQLNTPSVQVVCVLVGLVGFRVRSFYIRFTVRAWTLFHGSGHSLYL